ncbi:MAG: zinc ribbon domain-containing protein [Deltaproteobacteria bacterium]|nr:zinc ribbon domain-containing protein [Deltaproteobacteria bacterium]
MKTPIAASDLLGVPARGDRQKKAGTIWIWILGALAFAFVIGFGRGTDPAAARVLLALTAATATLAVLLLGETFASLRGRRDSSLAESLTSHAALEEEKKQILTALKELDFDRSMNKINESDFQVLRTRYERDALRVLKAIDEEFEGWRQKAEALATEHLGKATGAAASREPRKAETTKAAPPAAEAPASADSTGVTCPSCKTSNDADSSFCKKCGSRLPLPVVCGSCETRNEADAEFCTRCGTKLGGGEA